jgi:hypothetical protein
MSRHEGGCVHGGADLCDDCLPLGRCSDDDPAFVGRLDEALDSYRSAVAAALADHIKRYPQFKAELIYLAKMMEM